MRTSSVPASGVGQRAGDDVPLLGVAPEPVALIVTRNAANSVVRRMTEMVVHGQLTACVRAASAHAAPSARACTGRGRSVRCAITRGDLLKLSVAVFMRRHLVGAAASSGGEDLVGEPALDHRARHPVDDYRRFVLGEHKAAGGSSATPPARPRRPSPIPVRTARTIRDP